MKFVTMYYTIAPMMVHRDTFHPSQDLKVNLTQILMTHSRKFICTDNCSEDFLLNSHSLLPSHGNTWKLVRRTFQNGEWWSGSVKKDVLSLRNVAQALSLGYSLIFNKVQASSENIYSLVDKFQKFFGHKINANLYVTPGDHNQAFDAHFDWMDVLAIQISGCKRWRIYSPQMKIFPKQDQVFKPKLSSMTVLMEVDLLPGSFLYIPRGFVHEASTNCTTTIEETNGTHQHEMSMHLTLGIEVAKRSSVEHFLKEWVQLLITECFDFKSVLFRLDPSQLVKEELISFENAMEFIPTFLIVLIEFAADSEVGVPLRKPLILSHSILKYSYLERFKSSDNNVSEIILERSLNDSQAAVASIAQFVETIKAVDGSSIVSGFETQISDSPTLANIQKVVNATYERMNLTNRSETDGLCYSDEMALFLRSRIHSLLNSIFIEDFNLRRVIAVRANIIKSLFNE